MGMKIVEFNRADVTDTALELPVGSLVLNATKEKIFALIDTEEEETETYTIYAFKTGKVSSIASELEYVNTDEDTHFFVDSPDYEDLDDDLDDEEEE